MQAGSFLEEAVYEDRQVRREIHRVLDVFAEEVMQGYQDYWQHDHPRSQNEDYLSGWQMAEDNSKK